MLTHPPTPPKGRGLNGAEVITHKAKPTPSLREGRGGLLVIKCRLVPKDFCVNLLGTLWVRDPSWIDQYVVNHERIHNAQQRELLWIPFYVIYVLEWLVRIALERDAHRAYMNISFEREAYMHGHDLAYLRGRKHYSWVRMMGNN